MTVQRLQAQNRGEFADQLAFRAWLKRAGRFLEARGVEMSGAEQLPQVVDAEELERVLGADNSHGKAPAVI